MDSNFKKLFAHTLKNTLTKRQNSIVRLRYGFVDGKTYTLREEGQKYGLSAERIRQITQNSYQKIFKQGIKQIKNGENDQPCAELVLHLRKLIKPKQAGYLDRILDLASDNLSDYPLRTHALPLVLNLVYANKKFFIGH